MTPQPSLFDPPALSARRDDPGTSVDAAAGITPGRTEKLIVDTLRAWSFGMTADELAHALSPAFPPTVKTALSRTVKAGLVRDSGRTRPSVRGRASVVWVATT